MANAPVAPTVPNVKTQAETETKIHETATLTKLMTSSHVRWCEPAGKASGALALLFAILSLSSCVRESVSALPPQTGKAPLRFLMDRPPASLDPRSAFDADGQRINALLYSGLVRLDARLEPRPDLASGWKIQASGREIRFTIRSGITDHSGAPITAANLAACLEQYRAGKPISPYVSSFPQWIGTYASGNQVILKLRNPDPYIFRNLSLLRYFRVSSNPTPCVEPPAGEEIIGSGPYKMQRFDPAPETELTLEPLDPSKFMPVTLEFVEDDTTRVLQMLRGKIDATVDTITLTKTRWIQKNFPDRFRVLEKRGTHVGYMAFNLRDPILSKLKVRRAIALAIDRAQIIRYKMFGFASIASGLLAPELPEAASNPIPYDPALAEKLLDEAGYPLRGPDGVRLELNYKTTPVREGFEDALMFREMLAKIGVRLHLDVVEPAVFLQSVRKGDFQIYSSRWVGIADASILYRILDSKSPDDRVGYHNPNVDHLLESAMREMDTAKRIALMRQVQGIMARDLPYFPLWFWYQSAILRKDDPRLSRLNSDDLSITSSFEPVFVLR